MRKRIPTAALSTGIIIVLVLSVAPDLVPAQEPRMSANVLMPDPAEIAEPDVTITGELRQWHKVTLTIDGPLANEYGERTLTLDEETGALQLNVRPQTGIGGRLEHAHPNPFLDYRMTVTFTHGSGEPSYDVPGYFAADGNAAETGAVSGNKWRAHFSPDRTGRWDWRVSFVAGVNVSVDEAATGRPYPPYHGMSGSFRITESDKSAPDFRARGRLQYVGAHYLRFAGTGEYFMKAGSDSPETLLAYADFDGTYTLMTPENRSWIGPAEGHGLHEYAGHVHDWREGDPTWKAGKGKGLIGVINYLASEGLNSISFIPYTAGGDGENVWPFVSRNDKLHYDVSKLDQWQIVFDHAQKNGLFLHFKFQEQENDAGYPHRARRGTRTTVPEALDGGVLGVERKLYLRELIARFGYALALNWNLGEETTQTTEVQRDMAQFVRNTDPYDHHIVIHTGPAIAEQEEIYTPLLGDRSQLTGASLQIRYYQVHQQTVRWVTESRAAGKPWAVAADEQGPASIGTPPDPGYDGWAGLDARGERVHDLHDIRKYALWGALMAGAWGIEYYFGYEAPHNDLVAENLRSRDRTWDYARIALAFFTTEEIPFWEMENCDALVGNIENDNSRYCFAKPGELYLIYLPDGGTGELDLRGVSRGQAFSVRWFDPRNGGELRTGNVASVQGGRSASVGAPPNTPAEDWLVVVRLHHA